MKTRQLFLLFFLTGFLIGCMPSINEAHDQFTTQTLELPESDQSNETDSTLVSSSISEPITDPTKEEIQITKTPTYTPTPDLFSSLYGCEMKIEFTSGPLASKSTEFEVLTKDYFLDKGDKFATGKGTSIFYEEHHFFILHSSYVNGNILRPMEAEFLRKHLEYWGTTGNQYIQGQIDSLFESEVTWTCNDETVFSTRIDGITRLSHEASERLWLEPRQLDQILVEKQGEPDEWIGNIELSDESGLFIGFCGWGPEKLGNERYDYFRYLIHFEILP